MSGPSTSRRPRGLLALLGLAVVAALVAPPALVRAGDRAAARARAASDLALRLDARARADEWYAMAQAAPLGGRSAARAARRALAEEEEADFEAGRQSLAHGLAGVEAHLAWLDRRAAEEGWPGERARLARVRALASYGRPDPATSTAATPAMPFLDGWVGLAALWTGRLDAVPPGAWDLAPGLRLRDPARVPPAEPQGSPLARLVEAEARRRAGQPLEARRLLAPLLEAMEPEADPLAAAAAWSWARSLLDERSADPEGAMLVDLPRQAEPRALAGLRARLALAPEHAPAWAPAWLTLAELDLRLGQPQAALESAWAAVAAATPAWAPAPADLPAQARLDAVGAVHPDLVQAARLLVAEARQAAPPGEADDLALAEAALLVLQARGHLALGDPAAARGRLELAAERVPGSPVVTGWRVLTEVLDDRPDAARAALAALPELPDTQDDDRLRQVAGAWVDPPEAGAVADPARALRARLREPWSPAEPLAFARAHADAPGDLLLALQGPPEDRASLAQAHAQAWLRQRVARSLDRPTELAEATVTRDALAAAAAAEPLWALFGLGAFTIEGPALPAPQPPADGPADPGAQIPR
ncbi:hypothetical protein L6R53_19205 [Myxococcota bacterium]|nr:hypothetical protein [Myxococcota bacterium]